MAEERTTRPGSKRLWITFVTLFSFILGIPFWINSTQVYRASLPFKDIDTHGSWSQANSLLLPCSLNIIFPSPDESYTKPQLDSIASKIQLQIESLIGGNSFDKESCQTVDIQVTYDTNEFCLTSTKNLGLLSWPCGLLKYGLLRVAHLPDDSVDNLLWNYANSELYSPTDSFNESRPLNAGGLYTIVVMQNRQTQDRNFVNTISNVAVDEDNSEDNELNGASEEKVGTGWRTVVGKYRHAWIFGDFNTSTVEFDVVPKIGDVAVTFLRGSKRGSDRHKERNLPLSADGEAILSFSLLNAEPNDWIFDWNFEELRRQFFQPVLEAMKGIARLTIESQVLYYTPKAVQSLWDTSQNAHIVGVKQLPFFVNSNEWHLDTSSAAAGRSKLLHFAIYVPAAKEYPLHFQLKNGQLSSTDGFTSPGWGGVVVFNPKNLTAVKSDQHRSAHMITAKDFESVAGVIVAQLRTLFGLPAVLINDEKAGFYTLSAPRTGFTEWELDLLLRKRAISDMAASASTLMSLSRLVRKLPNMVIMDEIGEQVKTSLSAAAAARDHAAHGEYLSTAEAACKAASLAEAAFFQPSIMSVLYNPKEHHLAIYTPFFVPVLLHAVLAVLKEASRYRREWTRFKRKQE